MTEVSKKTMKVAGGARGGTRQALLPPASNEGTHAPITNLQKCGSIYNDTVENTPQLPASRRKQRSALTATQKIHRLAKISKGKKGKKVTSANPPKTSAPAKKRELITQCEVDALLIDQVAFVSSTKRLPPKPRAAAPPSIAPLETSPHAATNVMTRTSEHPASADHHVETSEALTQEGPYHSFARAESDRRKREAAKKELLVAEKRLHEVGRGGAAATVEVEKGSELDQLKAGNASLKAKLEDQQENLDLSWMLLGESAAETKTLKKVQKMEPTAFAKERMEFAAEKAKLAGEQIKLKQDNLKFSKKKNQFPTAMADKTLLGKDVAAADRATLANEIITVLKRNCALEVSALLRHKEVKELKMKVAELKENNFALHEDEGVGVLQERWMQAAKGRAEKEPRKAEDEAAGATAKPNELEAEIATLKAELIENVDRIKMAFGI